MKNYLHIVTPVSRPELITKIAASIAKQLNDKIQVIWHVVFDSCVSANEQNYVVSRLMMSTFAIKHNSPHHKAFAGHAHRNYFLNWMQNRQSGPDGSEWIYFLDDDTILHPDFIDRISSELIYIPDSVSCIIFNQDLNESTPRLIADRNNIKVGNIDMGMYMFRYNSSDSVRFDESDYCADGIYAEHLNNLHGFEGIRHLNQTLSFYNYLRPS